MKRLTGDDIRVAIAAASPLNDPRLSEIEWDDVAVELERQSPLPTLDAGALARLMSSAIHAIEARGEPATVTAIAERLVA